jgi:hypothetical protein
MEELDDMLKMLGLDEDEDKPKPPSPESDGGGIDLSSMDELERLLAADQAADREQVFEEMTTDLVNTRSIYDMGGIVDENAGLIYSKEDAEAAAKKLNKRSFFDYLTVKGLLTAGLVLVLIFILGGAAVVLASMAIAEQREHTASMAHFTPISMPANVPNNANFIHINEQLTLGEQPFTLLRISVGYTGTYFFFDEFFDTADYYIFLYDQNRHLYVRHQFDMMHDPNFGTILRFDPLQPSTDFLTLHIQHQHTREYGAFYYRLVGSFALTPPIYLNRPTPLAKDGDINSGLRISHAYFNNVESVIFYSFIGHFSSLGLRQRDNSQATFVHLWNDPGGGLMPLTEPQAVFHNAERDAKIGRATFGPLLSLETQVRVSFHDLFYVYPNPPVDLPLRFLGGRNQDAPHTLYMDRFRLNLEGIQQQGHLLVMVIHGLDESGLRLSTLVETSLEIDIGRGQTLTIPAERVEVSPQGTDVVFNLLNHMDTLNNVHIDRYTLVLHNVQFAVPEVSVTLDLADAVHLPAIRRETVSANLRSAFISRLAYMSGEIAHTSIIGFAPHVLADPLLAQTFARRQVTERPMYGATVIAGDFYDNYTFLAVVENEWVTGSGENLQFFRSIHHVIARSEEGVWSIVSDELITP